MPLGQLGYYGKNHDRIEQQAFTRPAFERLVGNGQKYVWS
jgi:hypothetical protein